MQDKIKGLDGIRGVAILMVIMSHASLWDVIGVTHAGLREVLGPTTGVSLFFVLSGFLITLLLLQEHREHGRIRLKNFMMRRVLRIFPVYYLAIFVLLFMDVFGFSRIKDCSFLYAATYTANFVSRACNHETISHFWSLAVEEHFYLFWPVLLLIGTRFAFVAAFALTVACLYLGTSILPSSGLYYPDRWTFPAMAPILVGAMTAFFVNSKPVTATFRDGHAGLLLIAIFAGLTAPAFLQDKTLWLVSAAALMLYIYHMQDSLLVKVLEFKPLAMIGVVSYGLYVWQGVFTGNGDYRSGGVFPPDMYTGAMLTFVVAPLSYFFFEKRFLKLKRHFRD